MVDATNQNCKEVSHFFNNYSIKHSNTKTKQKNKTYSSSYTEHVSALILHFVHVFFTLRHVLSEMVEIAPPYHTEWAG